MQQDYVEIDEKSKTADGVFDSERGRLSGAEIQMRWQGCAADIPLWVQWRIGRWQGQTQYNGYLQSGNQLVPFQARTGNELLQQHLRLGLPFDPFQQTVQIIPYFELARQRWTRRLVQYSETYDFTAHSVGLLAQWHIRPDWMAELGYQQGPQFAHLRAPSLAFDADLGSGRQQRTEMALHYRMTERLGVQLQASQTQYTNGQSAVVNDLQSPLSTTQHIQWGVAFAWHY